MLTYERIKKIVESEFTTLVDKALFEKEIQQNQELKNLYLATMTNLVEYYEEMSWLEMYNFLKKHPDYYSNYLKQKDTLEKFGRSFNDKSPLNQTAFFFGHLQEQNHNERKINHFLYLHSSLIDWMIKIDSNFKELKKTDYRTSNNTTKDKLRIFLSTKEAYKIWETTNGSYSEKAEKVAFLAKNENVIDDVSKYVKDSIRVSYRNNGNDSVFLDLEKVKYAIFEMRHRFNIEPNEFVLALIE